MADMMQFDLVSPERRLASVKASAVQIPGADGDMTAMANHAPVITTLRPGIVKVSSPEGDIDYVITGGFAEISQDGTSVLAERAIPAKEMTQAVYDDFVATVVAARDAGPAEMKDQLNKQVAEMTAVAGALGLAAK